MRCFPKLPTAVRSSILRYLKLKMTYRTLKTVFSILLFLFFAIASGTVQAQQGNPKQQARLAELLKRFPKADANHDGKLSVEEALAFRDARQKAKAAGGKSGTGRRPQVPPTHANVKYGPHDRNVFDLWLPETKPESGRFPVLIYFHGGGFVGGDKSGFVPTQYLQAGIACVSAHYRFVDGEKTLSPAPMYDGARVVQTIRHRAGEWHLDPGRIAVSGSSAGAVITMWIAYHDDLKNPDAKDPVERESTRVTCIAPLNAPTNLMPEWIRSHIGGAKYIHGSYAKMFGVRADEPLSAETIELIKKSSPWELVSKDDPPTLLVYNGKPGGIPLPEDASTGRSIHHPYFGKALKAKLDALGVECHFQAGTDPRKGTMVVDFLKNQFSMVD